MRQLCSESAAPSFFRPPGRGVVLAVSSRRSSPSSEGGTIRKQVRTASASALLVACHPASRPARCRHSSSSHSPTAPSGEPRARTQASTTFALTPCLLAVGVAGAARSRASASVTAHISERRTSSLGSARTTPLVRVRLRLAHRHERGRKRPRQRLDPTAVMPVDERAPARPPALRDDLEIGQHPTPGKELHHQRDHVGSEADIWPESDIRGARVGEGLIAASRRSQRPEELRCSGRVEDKPRGGPQREVVLGVRGRVVSGEGLGRRLVIERGANGTSAGVWE